MKLSVTVDISQFKKLCLNLRAEVPRATIQGVHQAMEEFKSDCLFETPSVPWDTMELAKSHVIKPTQKIGDEIIGTLKVSSPYAASLHEGISRWGTPYKFKYPGSGAKWIQSKMLRHSQKYVRIAGKVIKTCL